MRLRRQRRESVVTLDVPNEPDTLRRISLLNDALFKVAASTDVHLIEVRAADYRAGHLEIVIEAQDIKRPPSLAPSVRMQAS